MRLYLAGNFDIMSDKEKEKKMKKLLGDDYHRLCSFFFKQTFVVVDMIYEVENIPKPKSKSKLKIKRKVKK